MLHDRPFFLMTAVFVLAMALHCVVSTILPFDFRVPRLLPLAVAVIALRWGSIAGGCWGALGGLILALLSGEPPFAAATALTVSGWIAGEIPSRFPLESSAAIGLAIAVSMLLELALVFVFRGILPAESLRAAIWTTGWAMMVGPLLYGLVVHLSTAPPGQRLPTEPEA